MAAKGNPVCRQNDIVIQELKGELLIYDLRINKAFCLNETSALIWQLCDGNNSVSDISRRLSKKLKSPVTEEFVWLALDQLDEENLLSDNLETKTKFEGLSRREVIRRVGTASMIALPVIFSLVAPTAAMAASAGGACVPTLSPCTIIPGNPQGNCCSGNICCNDGGGVIICHAGAICP